MSDLSRSICKSFRGRFFLLCLATGFLSQSVIPNNSVHALAREKLGKGEEKTCGVGNGSLSPSQSEHRAQLWLQNSASVSNNSSPQNAGEMQNRKAWGKHGMLMFGGEKYLYASHLPMFHAPHDYQVIFRFHFRDQARHRQIMHALTQKAEMWTLDPAEFDLRRMSPSSDLPLKEFQTDVYRGHFEREGKLSFPAETVVIDQVLVFRQLQPQNTVSSQQYFLFPDGSHWYSMKRIDVRPDLDVLLRLRIKAESHKQLPCLLTLKGDHLNPPHQDSIRDALKAEEMQLFNSPQVIYRETGDLQ